jgi:hypothetical protein
MSTDQPTHPQATQATYWQPTSSPDYQILSHLRMRLVGLVAAMVVQSTIALLGVLPELPVAPGLVDESDTYYYATQPVSFWIQFAVIEFIAVVVVSLALGPGVRFANVPVIGRFVLGLAFVAVPAIAIVLGAFEAALAAGQSSPAAAASSWLATAFFAALFFGLPMIALGSRAKAEPAR